MIAIDSREQLPFTFSGPSEVTTLDAGDYSIIGLTHLIAVERKSLADLLSCIGTARERFKRELQRLRAYRFRMLIVEASAADLARGEWRSTLKPSHVLGSLAAWTAQYELPIWLAGNHSEAGRFCERYLNQAARRVALEVEAAERQLAGAA